MMTASHEITEADLERYVAAAAYVTARYGEVYAPLFDRLERELAAARRRADPVARARRYLQDQTDAGALKAIR